MQITDNFQSKTTLVSCKIQIAALVILTNRRGQKIATDIFNFGGSSAAFSFATIKWHFAKEFNYFIVFSCLH